MSIVVREARTGLSCSVPRFRRSPVLLPNPSPSDRPMSSSWGSAVIGFEFCAAIGGFAVIGFFIDRWQGTQPLWTLVLAGLGFIGGGYNLYKEVKKLQRQTARRAVRRDAPGADPKAASAEVAATRGRPRPTGQVNLFSQQELDVEDLDEVELDWPEDEKDQIERDLRDAERSLDPDEDTSR